LAILKYTKNIFGLIYGNNALHAIVHCWKAANFHCSDASLETLKIDARREAWIQTKKRDYFITTTGLNLDMGKAWVAASKMDRVKRKIAQSLALK